MYVLEVQLFIKKIVVNWFKGHIFFHIFIDFYKKFLFLLNPFFKVTCQSQLFSDRECVCAFRMHICRSDDNEQAKFCRRPTY